MNMIVLLSRTISPDDPIELVNGQTVVDPTSYIINPPDAIALEEAIQLKVKYGGTITVIMVSPSEGEKQLRTALAMGADAAILLEVDPIEEYPAIVARKIADYIKSVEFDLILAGDFATDGASSQVGPRVATILDIPYLTNIQKVKKEKGKMIVTRNGERDIETYHGSTPLLVTIPQGLHVPRLASVLGIIQAKKKPYKLVPIEYNELASYHPQQYLFPNMQRKKTMIQGDKSTEITELAQIIKKLK